MTGAPLSPHFLPNLIQARLDAHDAANPAPADYRTGWSEYHDANRVFAEALLEELARDHGARFKIGVSDTSRMTLDGISISCTSGEFQMLRGWVSKARRLAVQEMDA